MPDRIHVGSYDIQCVPGNTLNHINFDNSITTKPSPTEEREGGLKEGEAIFLKSR